MVEWNSYELIDFLMFSLATYARMIALHNDWLWPAHFLVLGTVIAAVAAWRHNRTWPMILLLMAAWVFVGGLFFYHRFSTIFWPASYIAGVFFLQAVLVGVAGLRRKGLVCHDNSVLRRRVGVAVLGISIAGYPLLNLITGQPITSSDFVFVTPDPTVMATFGLLLLANRSPWWLYPIPVIWCFFSGLMLYGLMAPFFWFLPAVVLAALLFLALDIYNQRFLRET